MATKDYYKGVTIQYKGDSTQLSKVLADMNSQMRQSQGAARQLDAALRMDPASLNLIHDRAEVVAKQIKITEERVQALRDALGKAEDPEVITRLTQQVDIAQAKLKNLNDQMAELGKKRTAAGGLAPLAEDAQTFGDKMQDVGKTMQAIGDKAASVGDTMTKHLTAPIVGFSAAAIGVATTVDTALTDVRKTVDGTERDYQKLKEAAIEYSKTNAVSADQVLQVEALGAQLGYTIDQLEMIGRVGSGLDIATDMNAEQATTDMAQFANITGMAQEYSENYASTIVALGNTTATTESKISSMAQRIAAAGSQVGMSNSEILGLAAGLSSVGMEAEAGGTAISTIISQIDKDVATGSENIATWAATAGMSAEQFASSWRDKPIEALEALLTNMGEAAKTGGNMSVMLENLGISSIRQTDAMKRLAGNSRSLTEAIDTANRAWQENTALSEEVANRNDSLAAKMEMLRNRVTAILEKIGKPLADALLAALDAAQPLFDAIESGAQSFADMDEGQQRAIVSALAMAAAFGPVLSVVGRATSDVGSLITALGGGAEALATIGEIAPAAGMALAAVFATEEVVRIVGGYIENLELVRDATQGVAEVTALAGGSVDDLAESVSALSEAEGGASSSSVTLAGTLKEANEGLRTAADYAKEAKDTLGELGTNAALVDEYANTMKELSSQSELTAAEQERLRNAVEQYNDITGAAIEITDATRGALSLLPGQIDEVTAAYKRQAEQKAYIDLYNDAIKAQVENEMKLKQVAKDMGDAYRDAADNIKLALDPLTALGNAQTAADMVKLTDSFNGLQQSSVDLANNVEFLDGKLKTLGDGSFSFSSLEAAMSAAGVTGQQYANLTESQLAEIRAAFDGTISSISGVLSQFGIAVGQTGAKAVSSVADATGGIVSAVNDGAKQAAEAQRKANDEMYRQQQKANERALKEQQKANERYNKQLQKQFAAEEKQRSKELSAEEDQIRKSNEKQLSEQKKQQEAQEKSLRSSLDKRYSARSKALDAEVDAARKASEKILKDLKASQAAEVKQYKAATDARIQEIDREYQAKVKLLEENDGTKQIDSRIKQLEDESEAEKRASTERDRAEKVAELQREVDRAKSRRKRAEAEKALADYLAEIAQENREQERKDEIDRLEEQKSHIKEETSAKKDALKEQADNAKEQYRQQREERLEQIQSDNEIEYEKRKEALDLEIEQRREQNAQILEDLKARNDEQIQQMRDLHEQQTSSLKEMLDNQLSATREAHETELENLKEQHSEIMDQTRENQQEELDALRDSQQEQLRALKDSMDEQVRAIESGQSGMVGAASKGTSDMKDDQAQKLKDADSWKKETIEKYKQAALGMGGNLIATLTGFNPTLSATTAALFDAATRKPNELPRAYRKIADNSGSEMKGGLDNARPSVSTSATNLVDEAERRLMALQAKAANAGYNGGTSYAKSIGSTEDDAARAARNAARAAYQEFDDVQNWTDTSGWNAGINFANGLSRTQVHAENAAGGIARAVASLLHHSTPDKGPLRGDDMWGAELVDNFIASMMSKESELATQSRRLASIVSDEFSPELSARYDASLNTAIAAQRQQQQQHRQWWLQGAAPSINVDLHLDGVTIDSSMDIRQTARDLAFETARQLAASLG